MGSPFLLRRADFEIPQEETYLDGAYMSPLPAAAREAVREAYDLKAFPTRVPYKKFFEYSDPIRELLGPRYSGYPRMRLASPTAPAMEPCKSLRACVGKKAIGFFSDPMSFPAMSTRGSPCVSAV